MNPADTFEANPIKPMKTGLISAILTVTLRSLRLHLRIA